MKEIIEITTEKQLEQLERKRNKLESYCSKLPLETIISFQLS